MEIYLFVWKMLAWSVTVSLLPPLTIPWGVLAYKIWHGNTAIDEELREELWVRSTYASFALIVPALFFPVLDYMIVDWLELPAGPVHIVILLSVLSLAASMLMYFFSLEDFFQGLILLCIYWYVPAALLWIIALIVRNPLFDYVLQWLQAPKA